MTHTQGEVEQQSTPVFILYKSGNEFQQALNGLVFWAHNLLLPVCGREVTSSSPWCAQWWLHPEAVAQLYGLWMAWQENTGANSPMSGPATWHRDYLGQVMVSLRDPNGPFAGCKANQHRTKETPYVAVE